MARIYTWIPFYMEFADKLRTYQNDRSALIQKIADAFESIGISLPKLEKDGMMPVDIDPFTVYGLFNKGIKESSRIAIIRKFAEVFNVSAEIPSDFSGVPVLNNLKATYYWFIGGREDDDIDNLWDVFTAALNYTALSTEQSLRSFCKAYNQVLAQTGVRWNLSMGLYWIRPYRFLSLDSRNLQYLTSSDDVSESFREHIKELSKNVPSAEEYLQICEGCRWQINNNKSKYIDFPSLSYYAWQQTKGNQQPQQETDWFPSPEEYTPDLTVEDWTDLLHNPDVFDQNSLDVIRAFYDIGGQATCSELAQKYGNTAMHYSGIVTGLAKRIQKATNCPLVADDKNENAKWWPILFVGKYADSKQKGIYIWKLRDELKMVLAQTTEIVVNTWLLTWNPNKMDWESQDDEYSYQNTWHAVKNGGTKVFCWRCISTKVKAGDRIFMIKLGDSPRGIFATGFAVSDSYTDDDVKLVDIAFTGFRDYNTEKMIPWDELKVLFPDQQWSPQGSGISIKPNAAKWLIDNWDNSGKSDESIAPVTKVTYLTEIIASLRQLGGIASLSEIYATIADRQLLPAITTNTNWKNNVNAEIQKHCHLTRSFVEGNEDLFYPVNGIGKGVWGLVGYKINEVETEGLTATPYTEDDFLREVYMSKQQYHTLTSLLEHRLNVILQGAPGIGKTYAAKRLAYAMMGKKDDSRIAFVQFHQSYSYEDFIMGYRPADDGTFALKEGIFYRFCETARSDPDRAYFFIIDEINRGNLSKIFGELLMLIEKDYRKETAVLAYSGAKFSVPENLYIIGMMNTADRSLAMIDYALRRRFSFFDINAGFDSDGFKAYSSSLQNDVFDALIGQVKLLNQAIEHDSSLGKGFQIGHSYFCNLNAESCTEERLRAIVEYDIIPMLNEYWFDDKDSVKKWTENLRGVFHDK